MFRIASTSEKLGKMLLKTTFYGFFCLMLFRKQPIKQKHKKKNDYDYYYFHSYFKNSKRKSKNEVSHYSLNKTSSILQSIDTR